MRVLNPDINRERYEGKHNSISKKEEVMKEITWQKTES
jgi:hypothetical protein